MRIGVLFLVAILASSAYAQWPGTGAWPDPGGSGGGGSGDIQFNTPIDTDQNGIPDTLYVNACYDGDCTGSSYSDIGAAVDWLSVGLDPAGNPASWRAAVVANNFTEPKHVYVLPGTYWGRGGEAGAVEGVAPRTGQSNLRQGEVIVRTNTTLECLGGARIYGPRATNTDAGLGGWGVIVFDAEQPGGPIDLVHGERQKLLNCYVNAGLPEGMRLELVSIDNTGPNAVLTFHGDGVSNGYDWPSGYFDGVNVGDRVGVNMFKQELAGVSVEILQVLSNTGNTITVTGTFTNPPVAGDPIGIYWAPSAYAGGSAGDNRMTVWADESWDFTIAGNEIVGSYHSALYGRHDVRATIVGNHFRQCAQAYSLSRGDKSCVYLFSNATAGTVNDQNTDGNILQRISGNLFTDFITEGVNYRRSVATDLEFQTNIIEGNLFRGTVAADGNMGICISVGAAFRVLVTGNNCEYVNRGVSATGLSDVTVFDFVGRFVRNRGVELSSQNTTGPVTWYLSDIQVEFSPMFFQSTGTGLNFGFAHVDDTLVLDGFEVDGALISGVSFSSTATTPGPKHVVVRNGVIRNHGVSAVTTPTEPAIEVDVVGSIRDWTFRDIVFESCNGPCLNLDDPVDGLSLANLSTTSRWGQYQGHLTRTAADAVYPGGDCTDAQVGHFFLVNDNNLCPGEGAGAAGTAWCRCVVGNQYRADVDPPNPIIQVGVQTVRNNERTSGIRFAGGSATQVNVSNVHHRYGWQWGNTVEATILDGNFTRSVFDEVYFESDDATLARIQGEGAILLQETADRESVVGQTQCWDVIVPANCVVNPGTP